MNFWRLAGAVLCLVPALFAQERPAARALPDFDVRVPVDRAPVPAADTLTVRDLASRRGIRARLTRTAGGQIKSLTGDAAALTAPSSRAREQIVRDFLRSEAGIFAFLPQNPDRLRLLTTDDSGGLTMLNFQQHQAGVPVYEATMKAGIGRNGELIRVDGSSLAGDLAANTNATLTAPQAIEAAYRANGLTLPGAIGNPTARGGRQFYPIANGPEIPVENTLLPTSGNAARLAYRLFIDAGPNADYEMLIDARDGSLLLRRNLILRAGQGRIWKETPLAGARELVDFPDRWLAPGAVATTGNNVDAYVDANGDGFPDGTLNAALQNGRAFSASQVFDFAAPETAGLKPADFKPAAVTNLFYILNQAHDYYYSLGFTEAAGNFQTDNFGLGGVGNDAVVARAQAGDEPSNASFSPRPDGLAGIMRVGLFPGPTFSSDTRDGDYDGPVLFHEMGHGVSTRLVGGPTNTGCLSGLQSRAMGEGWSDYFAASYYNATTIGAYSSQRAGGFRRQPYDTYTFTYEDLGNQGFEVHRDGEIWAAALWDIRTTIGSAEVTDKLVVAALKLTPCNPSMVDARDAIVQADQALNAGANLAKIWTAFARHGLGYSARGADLPYRLGLLYSAFYLAAYDVPSTFATGNQPPIITAANVPPAGVFGVPFSYQVQAADPEHGALIYTLLAGPAGMSVNASTGLLQWTPSFATARVKVEVKDAQGARAVLGFQLPVESPLAVGSTSGISGALNSTAFATFEVAPGTPAVQVTFEGSFGDTDFVLADPSGVAVSVEEHGGVLETGMISQPRAGRWTLAVLGYRAYQGSLSVVVPVVTSIASGAQQLSGKFTSQKVYKINIPPYSPQLVVQTTGGTGDVDLFIGRGYIPACEPDSSYCVYDSQSSRDGNTETVTVNNPGAGDWYITLVGYDDYADVTLVATAAPPIGLLPSQSELIFYTNVGVDPAPQSFVIGSDASIPDFTWTATVFSTGGWLQGRPGTGRKGDTAIVTPVATGLAAGTYFGFVTITAASVAGSPRRIGVTLVVSAASVTLPSITEVVNDASFSSGPISAGSWITIRGTALATTTRFWTNGDFVGASLPTSLDNVRVKVNGKDALVYYVSPTRIDVLTPDDGTTGPVPVTVTNGQNSMTSTVQLAAYSPGFFLFEPNDRKYVAAVHPDGTRVGPAGLLGATMPTRTASVGGRVSLYATGFGPTDPFRPANQILVGAAPLPAAAGLEITIGGVPAAVEFAGMVSNGQYQFNVVIPNVAAGDQPVVAKVGGVSSPTGSYLRIGAQ